MEDNMIRSFVAALVLSLFVAGSASAAKVDVSKLQLAGDITQAQAEIVLKGALAKAVDQGVPMNIAVVDAGGNLKAFLRMDGAPVRLIAIAQGKAYTAARMGSATADFARRLEREHLTLADFCDSGLTAMQGGLPLLYEGHTVLGVGVSGRSTRDDEALAGRLLELLRETASR